MYLIAATRAEGGLVIYRYMHVHISKFSPIGVDGNVAQKMTAKKQTLDTFCDGERLVKTKIKAKSHCLSSITKPT